MGRTLVGVLWCISGIAQAITVTPGGSSASLMASLTAPGTGLTVTGLSIDGHGAAGLASWGTYTNASGTYGIGPGIVISSGRVSVYGDGPNTSTTRTTDYGATATAAQSAILADISGAGDFYDVTQVNVTFDLDATTDSVYFDVTFGSEEFPEYVSSKFIDGFGLLVNGINIAFVDGKPVNVNHPSMAVKPGTQLDGVLAPGGVPVVSFSATVGANTTGNTLTFIIADRADRILDSTAYISPLSIGRSTLLLGGADAAVPEPASVVLLGSVMAVLAYSCRNRLRGLRF